MSYILDLLFPRTCSGCGRVGNYLCPQCLNRVSLNSCFLINDPVHEGNIAIFKYQYGIKKVLRELKYNFVTDLLDELVQCSVQRLKSGFPHIVDYWQKQNFVLIPVPLHSYRCNWRGFNQSALLGEKISQKLGLKYMDNCLNRIVNTSAQAKLKHKSERFKNPVNAFYFDKSKFEVPKNVILFDDVFTTGSTLNAAYKAFNFSDQNHCWFLSIAG